MQSRTVRSFGKIGDVVGVPNLIDIQRTSYRRFLQDYVDSGKRAEIGLEVLLREIFPIIS